MSIYSRVVTYQATKTGINIAMSGYLHCAESALCTRYTYLDYPPKIVLIPHNIFVGTCDRSCPYILERQAASSSKNLNVPYQAICLSVGL